MDCTPNTNVIIPTTTTQPPCVDCTPNTNVTTPTSTTEPGVTTTVEQLMPTTTTTTLVGQEGPTSTVDQSSGAATTTDPIGRTLPATGNGGRTANLTVIALTLIGIGAVMLRLASKPNR